MTDRVRCLECENMILPQTAADNAGLCGQCAKIPPEMRAASRAYAQRLAAGLVFLPDDDERSSSTVPAELSAGNWQLQPEFYTESQFNSPAAAIEAAKSDLEGNVFLVTEGGGELNVGFNERYGVCEYQNQVSGDFRYAYSDNNLRDHVTEEKHIQQACPCCGVGLLWYPSRFHLPRSKAFEILENAVAHRDTEGIEWLETGDISYTQPGRG